MSRTLIDSNTEMISEKKEKPQKFLLTNKSFELLREAQKRVGDETDMIPSFRKLVNELINKETVEIVIRKMIQAVHDQESKEIDL